MAALVLGPELDVVIQRIREHAEAPANWYVVGSGAPPYQTQFVLTCGTVQAVFSWTSYKEILHRHLTVSVVESAGAALPHVSVVATLAHKFGFACSSKPDAKGIVRELSPSWVIGYRDRCVIVGEQIRPTVQVSSGTKH